MHLEDAFRAEDLCTKHSTHALKYIHARHHKPERVTRIKHFLGSMSRWLGCGATSTRTGFYIYAARARSVQNASCSRVSIATRCKRNRLRAVLLLDVLCVVQMMDKYSIYICGHLGLFRLMEI